MRKILRALVAGLLFACCSFAFAQQPPPHDGNWIKKGVDAFDRVSDAVSQNKVPNSNDVCDGEILMAYVEGMLDVHQQNNLLASMVVYATDHGNENSKAVDVRAQTALAFTPLLRVPKNLPAKQVVAVLRKYLDENPGKWSDSAPILVTHAFEDAFKN